MGHMSPESVCVYALLSQLNGQTQGSDFLHVDKVEGHLHEGWVTTHIQKKRVPKQYSINGTLSCLFLWHIVLHFTYPFKVLNF